MSELRTIKSLLCVDILLELFQYFYVDELFRIFNDIIDDLPSLLKIGKVPLHIKHIDGHFRKHLLHNLELDHVVSIRITNVYQMAPVKLDQFNQARLLVLRNVTEQNWPSHFPNNLKYLIVYARSKHRQKVFENCISLENVDKLEFHSNFLHFHDSDVKLEKPSTIKHLLFNSQRCFINYQFLLNNMPDLKSLRSINTYYPHRFYRCSSKFAHLQTIDLVCRYIDIGQMIILLTQMNSCSLRHCRIVNIKNSLSSNIASILISLRISFIYVKS